jgi:hypothetical protein
VSNYTQSVSFTTKDGLSSGDPAKLIKGADFDTEFGAIATAVATKLDSSGLSSNAGMLGDIQALADPNADRILFWDDSADAVALLAPDGTTIAISGTTIATGSNVPLLNAANTFTQSGANLQIIQTTSAVPAYLGLTTNSVARGYFFAPGAANDVVANSAVGDIGLRAQSGSIIFSHDGGTTLHHKFTSSNSTTTFNGVAVSDFARLSQSNTFTGATQTVTASTARLVLNDTGSANAAVAFNASGTNKGFVGVANTTSSGMAGAAAGDMFVRAESGAIWFSCDGGSTGHLKITTTGITTPNTSASEVGFKGVPANLQSGNYTLVLTDAGKGPRYTGTGGHTFTIPANASVAFPDQTVIVITNGGSGSVSIAITTDTLYLAGTGYATTGTRTLAAGGMATLIKIGTAAWFISGPGLS